MKPLVSTWVATLVAGLACGLVQPAMARTLRVFATPIQHDIPLSDKAGAPVTSADYPSAIYSNTTQVRSMASDGETLWVATSGGLEQYDVVSHERLATFSTKEGLPSLDLDAVQVTKQKFVVVSVAGRDCTMPPGTLRFACSPLTMPPNFTPALPVPAAGASASTLDQIEGATVTARLVMNDGSEWLGTYGLGVWVRQWGTLARVTPRNQIASNHVVAMTEWAQGRWFATFDSGLSLLREGHFYDAALSPRMLNDVVGTSKGLFVATSEGLFVSEDGEQFRRELRVPERTVTDLAYDEQRQVLYVAATNSLWELDLAKARKYARSTYQPGGTRSLQAVDVSPEGTVFLASEDRGVLRREGPKRYATFDRLAGYASSWVIDVLALNETSALAGTLRHGTFTVDAQSSLGYGVDPWILFLGRDAGSKDTVFVGTQQGAAIVEQGKTRTLPGLPNSCVHTMARLSDGLWVGTEGGLALYR